jgi:hypothetical protein
MRMRASGLSAMLSRLAPASCSVRAPSSSFSALTPRGGLISTVMTNLPAVKFFANWVGFILGFGGTAV